MYSLFYFTVPCYWDPEQKYATLHNLQLFAVFANKASGGIGAISTPLSPVDLL